MEGSDNPRSEDEHGMTCSFCLLEKASPHLKCVNPSGADHYFCLSCCQFYITNTDTPYSDGNVPCLMSTNGCCGCLALDTSIILAKDDEKEYMDVNEDDAQTWMDRSRHGTVDWFVEVSTDDTTENDELEQQGVPNEESSTAGRHDEGMQAGKATNQSDDVDGISENETTLSKSHILQSSLWTVLVQPSELAQSVATLVKLSVQKAFKQCKLAPASSQQHATERTFFALANSSEIWTVPMGASNNIMPHLIHAVEQAIHLGRQVICPCCKSENDFPRGTQMECSKAFCRYRWCYLCGKGRMGSFCETCDNSARTGLPTNGIVLHCERISAKCNNIDDFCRQKTLYFLKKIKETVSPFHWSILQYQFNLQTRTGLSWHDVDGAEIKTYGQTRPENVAWESDMDEVISQLRVAMNEGPSPTQGSESCSKSKSRPKNASTVAGVVTALFCGVVICLVLRGKKMRL